MIDSLTGRPTPYRTHPQKAEGNDIGHCAGTTTLSAGTTATGLAGTTTVVAGRGDVTTTGSAGASTVVQALSPRMAMTKAIRIALLL
jgi:hypothetical protein